eukprot:COSAG04_NODE_181_length_21260_cov_200.681820_7_plen_222_part_00
MASSVAVLLAVAAMVVPPAASPASAMTVVNGSNAVPSGPTMTAEPSATACEGACAAPGVPSVGLERTLAPLLPQRQPGVEPDLQRPLHVGLPAGAGLGLRAPAQATRAAAGRRGSTLGGAHRAPVLRGRRSSQSWEAALPRPRWQRAAPPPRSAAPPSSACLPTSMRGGGGQRASDVFSSAFFRILMFPRRQAEWSSQSFGSASHARVRKASSRAVRFMAA